MTGAFLTDSVRPNNGGIQIDSICLSGPIQGGMWERDIHLRHNDAANILFWDGHVERVDRNGFAALGARRIRSENGTVLLP